jgi:hypothetical protein
LAERRVDRCAHRDEPAYPAVVPSTTNQLVRWRFHLLHHVFLNDLYEFKEIM